MSWRRSWVYENIHGKGGNGSGSKRKLLPDERSVWDDYLDLATPPNTPIAGQVCISKNIGYTLEQLAEILKSPVELLGRANKRMVEFGMVTVENSGIVLINNYHQYQSEYERQKFYRLGLSEKLPVKDDNRRLQRKITTDVVKDIYNHWNSLKIFIHKVADKHYTAIGAALDKGYTQQEIKTSMSNYSTILRSPRYFWKYKWECWEFVRRGIDKFADLDRAKTNFMVKGHEDDDEVAGLRKALREDE